MFLKSLFILCAVCAAAPLTAQNEGDKAANLPSAPATPSATAQAAGMETEVFRIPPDFISSERFEYAAVPPDHTRELLVKAGIAFPPGALAVFEPSSSVLIVRNTKDNLAQVRAYVELLAPPASSTVCFTAHLIQAPGPLLRLLLDQSQSASSPDQTADLERLLTEAKAPGSPVKVLHTAFLNGKSGQRLTLKSITEHLHITGMPVTAEGETQIETTSKDLGLSLEMDAIADVSKQTVQINLAPVYTRLSQVLRPETLTEPVTGSVIEMPTTEFTENRFFSPITLRSGQARLAGLWQSKDESLSKKDDIAQGFFITANIHTLDEPPQFPADMPELPADGNLEAPMKWTVPLPLSFLHQYGYDQLAAPERLLAEHGIELPKDCVVSLDRNGKLFVRARPLIIFQIYGWAKRIQASQPVSLAMKLHVFRADASLVRDLLAASAGQRSHAAAMDKLQRAVATGQASQITQGRIETKSGRQCILQSGQEHRFISELSWPKPGRPNIATETRLSGLNLELEASLDRNGKDVSVSYQLELPTASFVSTDEWLPHSKLGQKFRLPKDDHAMVKVQAATDMAIGIPHIVAAWQPVGQQGQTETDQLDIAFLTCDLIREKGKDPLPEKPAQQPPSKWTKGEDGMAYGVFRVPPDFLSASSEQKQNRAQAGEVKSTLTAKEILESVGIPFPDGSSAVYIPLNGLLRVKNTPENLDLVEAFTTSILARAPRNLDFSLHIFEAKRSLIDQLTAEIPKEADDHRPALEALLAAAKSGDATVAATLSLTTQGGHRTTTSQVQEHSCLVALGLDKEGNSATERETLNSGTALEIDPALGANGTTLDLNIFLEHHTAPPVRREENLAADGEPPVLVPLTDFHLAKVSASLTLTSGTARILSIWKPTGRPDDEMSDRLQIAILQGKASNTEE